MANIKRCDKCGAIYQAGAPVTVKWGGLISFDTTIDLCQDCKSELRKWVKNNGE